MRGKIEFLLDVILQQGECPYLNGTYREEKKLPCFKCPLEPPKEIRCSLSGALKKAKKQVREML